MKAYGVVWRSCRAAWSEDAVGYPQSLPGVRGPRTAAGRTAGASGRMARELPHARHSRGGLVSVWASSAAGRDRPLF
eukprot:1496274-Pyramimonas_sp.AAC.1